MKESYSIRTKKKLSFTYTKSILAFLFMIFTSAAIYADNADVVVNTIDSQGNPISGVFKIFKGPNYIGQFNSGVAVSLEVGSTYKLKAIYENTSTGLVEFVVAPEGNTFNYSTTKVTFHWSGGYLDYRGSGSWRSFGKTDGVWNSRELFPKDFNGNTMKIHIGYKWNDVRGMIFEIDYEGITNYEKVLSQLRLLDHSGNPLSGAPARGGYTTPTVWHVPGVTNANGLLLDIRNGTNENLSYEIKYNNTISISPQQESSLYEFQTELITMRLESCDSTPTDGGHVRWGHGASFGTYNFVGGNTGSSAPGESQAEFFPGTYSFEMGLSATTNTKISYNFPGDGATVTWQTIAVTLQYSGVISYGGGTGDARYFNKPTMDLMPGGTYNFHFRNGNRTPITLENGCDMTKSVQVLRLTDSNGDPLSGGTARGGYGNNHATWHVSGSTDANGVLFDIRNGNATTMSYEMRYNNTASVITGQDVTVNSIFEFQTELITMRLESCDSTPTDGGHIRWGHGASFGTYNFVGGNTGSSAPGESQAEFFPGTYSFEMGLSGTTNTKISYNFPGDGATVTWQTIAVTLQYSGTISFGGSTGNARYFNKPTMDLMPGGTYNFHFRNGNHTPITLENGCDMTKSVQVLRLTDSNGDPLSGGTARGGYGNNHATWFVSGSTDADGVLFDIRNGNATTMSYEMRYNNTASVITGQDVTANSIFEFQTELITMRLENCDSTPIDGGHIRWGPGSSFGTYHFVGGNTGSSAPGESQAEFFPGTYSFEMGLSGTTTTKISYNFPGDGATVTWQTIAVTLQYSGTISFGGPTGDTRYFNKPTMDLMPGGTYNFHFRNGYHTPITLENGCEMTKSALVMQLIDSNGDGLEGGIGKYNLDGWQIAGTTDADGNIITLLDGLINTLPFRMYWEGVYNQKNQNISTNPIVVFETVLVQMELKSSIGVQLPGEGKVNSGGWKSLGTTPTISNDGGMELLPRTYAFRMYYEGVYNQKNQNVSGGNTLVTFNTVLVQMELLSSLGAQLPGEGKVNSGGWKSLGTTPTISNDGGMELLPRTYAFRMYWEGVYIQKNQNVSGGNTLVTFETVLVQMELLASDGTTPLAGEGKVNSDGWKSLGTTPTISYDGGMELLPKNYPFRMYWEGVYNQKNQNVSGGNTLVTFETVLVTTELVDKFGDPIDGGEGKVNSGGWKSLGSTPNATMELLPRNYAFRMYWDGESKQKNQNVKGGNTIVLFTYRNGVIRTPGGDTNVELDNGIPITELKLYPNPFSNYTTFRFQLEEKGNVNIIIYDMLGKVVKNITNSEYAKGTHEVKWNGTTDGDSYVATGIYLLRVKTGASVSTIRIIYNR